MGRGRRSTGLKPKDLCGIPWRVAFALQEWGWWLRRDIVWSKPNPMPESVTDRPTTAHEYIFLMTKCERYFYEADAISEDCSLSTHARVAQDVENQIGSLRAHAGVGRSGRPLKAVVAGASVGPKTCAARNDGVKGNVSFREATAARVLRRNKRSVWTIATQPFSEAHFATFPEEIPRACISAGSRVGALVLDPFSGAGTTGLVALELGREYVGIDRSSTYIAMSDRRLRRVDAWQPPLDLPPSQQSAGTSVPIPDQEVPT